MTENQGRYPQGDSPHHPQPEFGGQSPLEIPQQFGGQPFGWQPPIGPPQQLGQPPQYPGQQLGQPAQGRGFSALTGVASILHYMIAGAGLIVFIAAFLPWGKITFLLSTISGSGIDGGHGWITLCLGLIAVGIAVASILVSPPGVSVRLIGLGVAAAVGLIITGIAVYDFANFSSNEAGIFGIEVSAGIGLYLTLFGGLVILGGGTTLLVKVLQNR